MHPPLLASIARRVLVVLSAAGVLLAATPARADDDDSAVDLRIYGDTGFTVRNHANVKDSFDAARLDFFPTASIDRLSFLAEAVFEAGENNEFGIDVERMQVAYLFADWFRLKAGRMHTAYGYYNDAYHHGKIFELATDRPFAAQFEDGAGLLQAHIVGAAADGKIPLGSALDVHYDVEVGNGRGFSLDEVSVLNARKNDKMVNARLRLLPHFLEGLIIGGNIFRDEIPAAPAPATPATPPTGVANSLREIVVGAHVAYMEHGFHVILEGSYISHKDEVLGTKYADYSGFVEFGYTIGTVTPYTRTEHILFDAKLDPLYQEVPLYQNAQSLDDVRLGVKWAATENLALKLEGRTLRVHPGLNQQSGTIQVAFGF
jgi:hypothetical protein